MSATILLIRHPESVWNRAGIYQGRRDTPLSSLGALQAELVAKRLSRERLDGIVCSPLARALALARAIGHHHDLEPIVDDRLTEIAHGPWEGLHRRDVAHRFPALYQRWVERPHEVTFPDGESLADVHERAMEAIEHVLLHDGTWVVVTHDTVARLIVAAANEQPIAGFAAVSLENAAITTLVGPIMRGSIRHLNDVSHLGRHRVQLEGQAL